jgi:large subunit ribosomal protein L31
MKADIHPAIHDDATITCACGAVYNVRTTRPEAKVAICAGCHPFFTGKKRFVDTEGRMDRFRRRYQMAAAPDEE